MTPIVVTTEISRRPDDVFAYVTDPTKLPEWQESIVRVESSEASDRVGRTARITRRVGPREMTMDAEIAELNPPTSWSVRGLDGPVRGDVKGKIEPLDGGERSRVTIELALHGHGMGKLLLPLVVRRKAETEMPRNMQHLKEHLEQART
jgi:uncharacterized protein YndB with AHSA1/START domain